MNNNEYGLAKAQYNTGIIGGLGQCNANTTLERTTGSQLNDALQNALYLINEAADTAANIGRKVHGFSQPTTVSTPDTPRPMPTIAGGIAEINQAANELLERLRVIDKQL